MILDPPWFFGNHVIPGVNSCPYIHIHKIYILYSKYYLTLIPQFPVSKEAYAEKQMEVNGKKKCRKLLTD